MVTIVIWRSFIGAIFALLFLCSLVSSKNYKRVCYFTNWSQFRWRDKQFKVGDIDPKLCMHVNYYFARINDNHELDTTEYNDHESYKKIVSLKKDNPDLKILLSVGGYTHEEEGSKRIFSLMVNNDDYRRKFVKSTVGYLSKWNFDGLDLHLDTSSGDKEKYTQLVRELATTYKNDKIVSRKERLLLTAAVPAVEAGYEVDKLANYFDWINLMTYDLHGNWEDRTGHHTAMESTDGSVTVSSAVDNWIQKGFPANKIVLGLATYGRTFTLADEYEHGLNAQKSNAPKGDPDGPKPTRTDEMNFPPPAGNDDSGYMAYHDICQEGFTIVRENETKAPYGYKGKKWVGFDDVKSLIHKVRKEIKKKGLAGAMFWTLDMDDFSGTQCEEGSYPLMTAVKSELTAPLIPLPGTKIPSARPLTKIPSIQSLTTMLPPLPNSMKGSSKQPDGNKCFPYCHGANLQTCVAAGAWKGQPSMTKWCEKNSPSGHCPASHCKCETLNFE